MYKKSVSDVLWRLRTRWFHKYTLLTCTIMFTVCSTKYVPAEHFPNIHSKLRENWCLFL